MTLRKLKIMLMGAMLLLLASGGAFATTIRGWESTNPVGVGQGTNLFGTVTGTNPTGTVTFKDGATSLGVITLSNSTGSSSSTAMKAATFTTTGSHSITATYSGDANDPAVSTTWTVVVNAKATTSLDGISISPSPAVAGESVTLSVRLNGNYPTGQIVFKDGSTILGISPSINPNNSVGSINTTFSTIGSHSITASYAGDDKNYASTSAARILQVVGSITSLSSSPNPALLGEAVGLTATVRGTAPTGTVTFNDATTGAMLGSAALDASGVAVLTSVFTTTGNHSLTAVYAGNNPGSTSGVNVLTVQSSRTVLTASPNPVGEDRDVTLTAEVTSLSAQAPTGNVIFKSGSTTLGQADVDASGHASLLTSFNKRDNYSLTATYGGDANNGASTSGSVDLQVNSKTTSTTTLAASRNPAVVGKSVTFTATVTGSSPTGTVTFKDGSTTLGQSNLNNGIAIFNKIFTTTGSHAITANYGGSGWNTSSSAALSLLLNAKEASTTTLAVAPNPANAGQQVTLTAAVTGDSPSGSVTFYDGAASLGVGTITNGIATFAASFTTTGSYSITASYGGDTNNQSSVSVASLLTVSLPSNSTLLSVNPNPAMSHQVVTLQATVTGSSPGSTPTGIVTFNFGSITRTAEVIAGKASFLTALPAGEYSIFASYGGDANNVASSSVATSLTVTAAVCPAQ